MYIIEQYINRIILYSTTYIFIFFLYTCIHEYMYTCVPMWSCAHVFGVWHSIQGVIHFSGANTLFYKTESLNGTWGWLIRLCWLANDSEGSSGHHLHTTGMTSMYHSVWLFLMWWLESNSGPSAYVISTYSLEHL